MGYEFRTDLRSHELRRETAWERAKALPDGQRKSRATAEKLRQLGLLKQAAPAETFRIRHNGGGLETEIQRSPFSAI